MSEQKERGNYAGEFKVEAVRRYGPGDKSLHAIEQELGITPFLLSKWFQGYRQGET